MKLTGENRRTREKTCPSATLSTTKPTWTDPGSNPGLRDERQATNILSHGTALTHSYSKGPAISHSFAANLALPARTCLPLLLLL
jgi:hypothetical protein